MKLTLVAAALCGACASAVAQGALNFCNYVPGAGINAPVFDYTPYGGHSPCAGTAYAADLFWGPAGTTDDRMLFPLNQPAFFATGAGAGYFFGGARSIPNAPGGTTITVQVRVWDTADGNTYDECVAHFYGGSATARVGMSALFSVTLPVMPAVPANLTGLSSFAIVFIPEPSMLALAGVGMAWYLISRRRLSG